VSAIKFAFPSRKGRVGKSTSAVKVATVLLLVAGVVGAQATDFLEVAKTGTPAQVRAAIKAGADVNARTPDGWTALLGAAKSTTTPEVVSALLKAGADGTAKDNSAKTAWDHAHDNERLTGTDAYWKLNDARF
jgi:ankyrin repeat protein